MLCCIVGQCLATSASDQYAPLTSVGYFREILTWNGFPPPAQLGFLSHSSADILAKCPSQQEYTVYTGAGLLRFGRDQRLL